jgi:transporter family protein
MVALQAKIIATTLVSVLAQELANLALSRGLRIDSPPTLKARILRTLTEPMIWLAVACLTVNWFLWLGVLSWANLSFVIPITASSYLINALLVGPVLGEHVSRGRWLGTLIIFVGVMVIVLEPGTTP